MHNVSNNTVQGDLFDMSRQLHDTLANALSTGYKYLRSLKPGHATDNAARKGLAEAASKLLQLATAPEEYLDQLAGNNQILISIRWLVRLNVLDHVPKEGDIAYPELASAANVPESQLKSVARMTITNGFMNELKPGLVSHSRFSALLFEDQNFMDWARFLTEYSVPAAYRFPEATERWGWTEAKDETAFSIAMNKQMPFFDYVSEEPGMTKIFSSYMRNVASTNGMGLHHLLAGFAWYKLPAGSLIVDVGGSRGHASIALAQHYPCLNFIVQDLPETIAGADEAIRHDHAVLAARIKFMGADFFNPQAVIDADVYLLRMIIHDWPDAEALTILMQLQAALQRPGARIIIMDTVLPEPGSMPTLEERTLRVRDLTMVQVFNAKEREYEAWDRLLRRAGLQIINSEHPIGSVMSVLEVGLLEEHPRVQCDNDKLITVLDSHVGSAYPTEMTNGEKTSKDVAQNPVIIVGAGIGGLCLAQGLKKADIDFTVLERDTHLNYRPQGYRLKIEDEGVQALKACLSDQVYKCFERSCAFTTLGQTDYNPFNCTILRSREGSGLAAAGGLAASATVDRGAFREILMTGISEHVRFDKHVASYDVVDAEESVIVRCKDGTSIRGQCLVGADGVRSSIRKIMLPSSKYVDTGAMCVYGKTPISPELLHQFPALGLRWMTCCVDKAPSIQSILIGSSPLTLLCEPIRFPAEHRDPMNLPADYVYWVLIGRKELFAATSDDAARISSPKYDAADAVQLTLELTKEWHPSINSLFRLQDGRQCSNLQVVSALPDIPPWESSRYVTLIGDAIHAMSPCGGVGANTALADAADLCKVMVGAGDGKLSAAEVGAYEERMRKRASKSVMRSFVGSKKMFDQRPFEDCSMAVY